MVLCDIAPPFILRHMRAAFLHLGFGITFVLAAEADDTDVEAEEDPPLQLLMHQCGKKVLIGEAAKEARVQMLHNAKEYHQKAVVANSFTAWDAPKNCVSCNTKMYEGYEIKKCATCGGLVHEACTFQHGTKDLNCAYCCKILSGGSNLQTCAFLDAPEANNPAPTATSANANQKAPAPQKPASKKRRAAASGEGVNSSKRQAATGGGRVKARNTPTTADPKTGNTTTTADSNTGNKRKRGKDTGNGTEDNPPRRSKRAAGLELEECTVEKLQQDNNIINLHASARCLAVFNDQSAWPKYRANDFDQFLNGFALAGVQHPKHGCNARVPPLDGRNAIGAQEMYKAGGIDGMFKDLIDTVHPFKVHAHPCCCCLAAHVLNASMHVAGAGHQQHQQPEVRIAGTVHFSQRPTENVPLAVGPLLEENHRARVAEKKQDA